MCNCIAEIEEKIKNREGAAFAFLDNLNGHQKSEVRFKRYTKNGDVSRYFKFTSVPWKFCPFCGVKI